MITAERQKVVEKEAETERKRAVIGNTYDFITFTDADSNFNPDSNTILYFAVMMGICIQLYTRVKISKYYNVAIWFAI